MPNENLQEIKSGLELKNSINRQKTEPQPNVFRQALDEAGIDYLG